MGKREQCLTPPVERSEALEVGMFFTCARGPPSEKNQSPRFAIGLVTSPSHAGDTEDEDEGEEYQVDGSS